MKENLSGPTKDDGSCAEPRLMPTLLPTGATPDVTRRTYRICEVSETGLLALFHGRCGTVRTQSYTTENHAVPSTISVP
jgi:hypothetical protein